MPPTPPRVTKAERREAARAEAARLREEQQRRARRTRTLAIAGLAAAVVVLVVVVVLVLRQGAATREAYADVAYGGGEEGVVAPALADVPAPGPADDAGGVTVTADGVAADGAGTGADAPVEVAVYLDFMCPFCGQFEQVNGPVLAERVDAGEVAVTYHVVSILDSQSAGSLYSTRAANAAAVVADADPDHYADLVAALFADQPEEGTVGLTDAEIADLARGVGVPDDVVERFTQTTTGTYPVDGEEREGTWRTFAPWVDAATAQASADLGQLRTPTVLIDGEPFTGDLTTAGPLEAALDAAAG